MGASLFITGCETLKGWGEAIPSTLEDAPLMHHVDVQQGNIVTQDMINRLRPGMARRQVRYIMGTPILVDVFHQDRWDYIYSNKPGGDPRTQKTVSLFFEDGKLVRIEGDFRPRPVADPLANTKETVVSVPDQEEEDKGYITRTLEKLGITDDSGYE
ncbi:MAG TPA: outer membrane protein assembly factor BamE [Sedimenticola sp.]|nr:outer membrane protein assembly factor BamE [Sedimenticola sp.]